VYPNDFMIYVLTEERRLEREMIERYHRHLAELGPPPTNSKRLRRSLAAGLAAVRRRTSRRVPAIDRDVTTPTTVGTASHRTEREQTA
jgi:hypothetical protein